MPLPTRIQAVLASFENCPTQDGIVSLFKLAKRANKSLLLTWGTLEYTPVIQLTYTRPSIFGPVGGFPRYPPKGTLYIRLNSNIWWTFDEVEHNIQVHIQQSISGRGAIQGQLCTGCLFPVAARIRHFKQKSVYQRRSKEMNRRILPFCSQLAFQTPLSLDTTLQVLPSYVM